MTQSEQDLLDGNICGPHCDSAVLHEPGTCEFCDEFPLLQKARQLWGIAYTGEAPGRTGTGVVMVCPSEMRRELDVIHRWPGNRPTRSSDTPAS